MGLEMRDGAYHIGKDAILICNKYRMRPAESLVWLEVELEHARRRAEVAEHALAISDKKPLVLTLQEFKDGIRGVLKAEGVKLDAETTASITGILKEMLIEIRKLSESDKK